MASNFRINISLSFISLFGAIIITIFLDRLVGFVLPQELIYPPNSSVRYKTTEFDIVVHTNNLGFRGPPLTLDPFDQKFQIITLGDSFTYGWGANEEEVWSTVLSNSLNEKGMPVEIANLGWGGVGPTEYANLAEKAIPLLKPNLVIVAILQGDDLQQLDPTKGSPEINPAESTTINFPMHSVLQRLYPNVTQRLLQRKVRANDLLQNHQDIQSYWQQYASEMLLNNISPEQAARFQTLDWEIQQLFHEGLLNPGMIYDALRTPDYFLKPIDLTTTFTQARIEKLASELDRIKRVAQANKAEVIVVAVPVGVYTNERGMESRQRLGFSVDPKMLSSTAPDETIALAAEQAGLKFYSVLDSFRQYQGMEALFYPIDGHFTVAGNRLFSINLLPVVEDEYQRYQQKN